MALNEPRVPQDCELDFYYLHRNTTGSRHYHGEHYLNFRNKAIVCPIAQCLIYFYDPAYGIPLFKKLSEYVNLYFWIKYIFIVNIVGKHLYRDHF